MGVTPGEVLISGHTIRLDEITMSASIHWSAILYSILTDNLEVPITILVSSINSMTPQTAINLGRVHN